MDHQHELQRKRYRGGHSCGTDLSPYVNSGALCTISGTDKNCSFNVDLTTLNGGVGIAADSCFQLQITGSGSPTATSDVIWDVACSAGASGFSSVGSVIDNRQFYCGSGLGNPSNCSITAGTAQHFVNWSSSAINACAGWFAVQPAPVPTPNATSKWDIGVEVSTTAVGPGQTCADLSYTALGGCTINSTDRSCSLGSVPSCTVPASGGCYRFVATPGGAVRMTSSQKFNLDVGDPAFALSRTGSWGAGSSSPVYLATRTGSNSTALPGYVVVPHDLTSCDGGFMQATVVPASNQADLEVVYSTTALSAGQKCSDLTYATTGTVCSVTAGNKSCTFSAASVPAVAGGCMRLKYVPSGTFGAGDATWGWYCE